MRFGVVKASDIATNRRTYMDPGYWLDRREAEAALTICADLRLSGRVRLCPCAVGVSPVAWTRHSTGCA